MYASIGTGKTEGVFQLESSGMKNFMKELQPKNLEDVIAGISLYRPGPMDFIPQYIRGKNHPESITYDCPQLEEILEPTYGCIVYQEQVMQIVQKLAGYTLGTKRPGAPCHVEEEGVRHGEGAAELRLWKRGGGRARLHRERHPRGHGPEDLRRDDRLCQIRLQ